MERAAGEGTSSGILRHLCQQPWLTASPERWRQSCTDGHPSAVTSRVSAEACPESRPPRHSRSLPPVTSDHSPLSSLSPLPCWHSCSSPHLRLLTLSPASSAWPPGPLTPHSLAGRLPALPQASCAAGLPGNLGVSHLAAGEKGTF